MKNFWTVREADQSSVENIINQIREFSKEDIKFALDTNDKNIREERLAPFKNTLEVVDTCHFDAAFTFIYSPREGTPAAKMEDNVTMAEKKT